MFEITPQMFGKAAEFASHVDQESVAKIKAVVVSHPQYEDFVANIGPQVAALIEQQNAEALLSLIENITCTGFLIGCAYEHIAHTGETVESAFKPDPNAN